ncbi:MAG TPA: DUF1326 domain-containing protein [Thermodesulfobacteriota bacterium]|nr:DUF1326 domain-containing protein [Thermodesulfobacteriota bacterium]
MAYELEGRLLEVCNCNVLCPCWIGENPDNGTCDSVNSWHIDKGTVDGVDVSGLTIATLNRIPGNVLKGNWRVLFYVDDKATPQQQEALLNVFTGKLGGPAAGLAQLYGEIVGVERVPITFEVEGGKGRVQVGQSIEAELEPYQGATGQSTKLYDTAFTTIPGSPAYVSKALKYKAKNPVLNFDINMQNNNAIQGHFRFKD